MTSTLPPIVQAFSGSIGSASANALTYPLDLVTTRLQLDPPSSRHSKGLLGAFRILHHIIVKHGLQALYDGIGTDMGATLLSNFFYFYFYSYLRDLSTHRMIFNRSSKGIASKPAHKPAMLEELVLGYIAGVASRAVSTPLNIITLKLQTERESEEEEGNTLNPQTTGVIAAVSSIYEKQGLKGFWRGFQTTTLLSLNPSLTMALFQLFRRLLSLSKGQKQSASTNPKPGEAFIGAAMANSIAVTILYPLILAKTRLQASSSTSLTEVLVDAYCGKVRTGSGDYVSEKSDFSYRKVEGGVKGLYQGLEMQILKGFLSQGVTFLVKGRIEQMIVAAYLRRKHA